MPSVVKHAVPSAERDQQARQRRHTHVHAVGEPADREREYGDLERRHRRRADSSGDVGPAWQRRSPHAFEHAVVTQDRGADRDVDERRRDHRVGQDAGHEIVVVGDMVAPGPLAVIDRPEDEQEHDRQQEREERARAIAPERPLLIADLPERERRSRVSVSGAAATLTWGPPRSARCPPLRRLPVSSR